ncbi:MAG: hypothetical protein J6A45_07145, partial [Lachnospiraceae bacterium]|nr:hypothetical protein [Lachnospiraceae bacterium]
MKKLKFFMKEKNRLIAWTLAAVMALSGVPIIPAQAADSTTPAPGSVTTVHDPETLHRPIDIYGQNTLNGGKITVGKSVDTTGFENDLLDGVSTGGLTPATNNFLV